MNKFRLSIAVLALGALAISLLLLGGCAKKLEGDAYENQKPIVWFVNVPPESARSSVNPIVNWYGQDQDGQIDFYRYMVIREDIMGDSLGKPVDWNPVAEPLSETEVQSFVEQTLMAMSDTLWTRLLVRADSVDPHTSNIIPMSAQIDNPVLVYVPQFVFVQAFDEEGLGSDVVYRRFLRNDNPPATRIVGFIDGVPFINSEFPTGSSTGIRIRWTGTDVIDYPSDPPPFEFEWKLFGPYTQQQYNHILDMQDGFLRQVFVTNDARILYFGEPPQIIVDTFWNDTHTAWDSIKIDTLYTSLIVCDTTYEGGVEVESCDTILIDTLESGNVYGVIDTLLQVYTDEFISSEYYIVADSSHDEYGNIWTTETRDSVYNVYQNHPADTTQAGKFIFVVRARDDAKVPDLTPAYKGFTVINPQHERDILIIDWGLTANENRARAASQNTFWRAAVPNWITQTGHDQVVFTYQTDMKHLEYYSNSAENLLKDILKYKVAIMMQDAAVSGLWSSGGELVSAVMTALQTGVNVWVNMRVPIGTFAFTAPYRQVTASTAYQLFFGVQQYTFPGWGSYLIGGSEYYGLPRTEDFVGALSLDRDQWPDLTIDTMLLRQRYIWEGYVPPLDCYTDTLCNPQDGFPFYPHRSDQFTYLGALPQVGWCVRTYDTEAMYLYRSLYGNEHGIYRYLSFHGRPVGIRLNRGLFRTVHFLFSPIALKAAGAQEITNNVLNWLYDGRTSTSSAAKGTTQQAALADEIGNRYWDCYWQANGDKEKFFELFQNAF